MSALTSAFESISDRRVILIGGKGGVGKTTVARFAARHLEKSGKVILFSTDAESLGAAALYARFLRDNLEQILEIGDRGTYLDREELRRFFELALPGIDEIMAWMRIGELAEENPEATVVVDMTPTGHALRMLGASDHFRHFAAALDAMQEKHRGIVRQLTRRDVRDAIDVFIDDFEAKARRRRELLEDPARTSFIPVVLSEPWVVEQTLRLIEEVRIDVPFVVLNRVVEPDCPRCVERKAADDAARARFDRVVDFPRWCIPPDAEGLEPEKHETRNTNQESALEVRSRIVFFAGKGGVGKTTCAVSLALQLARAHPQKRYTLISVDPAHAVRDVFAREAPPPNLTVEAIDTRAKWRRFRDTLGVEIERAMNALTPAGFTLAYDTDALQKLVEVAPPGADELFAINRLAELAVDESQDRIIVDTAPTGHFLRLLDLPQTATEWVREFMRILLRYREVIPAGSLGEELVHASRSLTALDDTLRSERSSVVVVTRPERAVITETNRLLEDLSRRGIRVAGVIANSMTPDSDCPCDRSMRAWETAALAGLRSSAVPVARQDAPVTRLDDLARLVSFSA